MDRANRRLYLCLAASLLVINVLIARGQQGMAQNPADLTRVGDRVIKVNEAISMVEGFGNTFLLSTSEGNVVIDTSIAAHAQRHKPMLTAENKSPIKYIILTHGHGDHTGGVALWKQPGTQIIAQKNHVEFLHYQTRLGAFYARRNAAQFGGNLGARAIGAWPGNYAAKIEPTILFDEKDEFTLGGVKIETYRAPSETYDHLMVWVPKYKAVFTGDVYYESFPNLYTLRGTEPRWALDYVNSLNGILALKPEILLPSHGLPIRGNEEITRRLTRYRDAIQYVHDEVVKGMNAGKNVYTLMHEIKLPAALEVGESYGKLTWSIRGIYEGYVGWFDLNPVTMYETPVSSVYPELVKLAGGADAVAVLAAGHIQSGDAVAALHLTDIALASDASHRKALDVRLKALEILRSRCKNTNERGWLDYSIRETKAKMGDK
ncbi:MAG TPA: MBL fold metallo-hydrolase [Blastocatellia bacterium]|nr:MBL fold metallo-hydrolase [Blastocatellia bacterium]